MTSRKRQLGLLVCAFALLTMQWGCTDGRRPVKQALKLQATVDTGAFLTARNNVQYQNSQTNILATAMGANGRLYVSGFGGSPGFGFASWDIAANPEVPRLLFAAGTQIDTFAQGKPWTPDAFGTGALGVIGRYVFSSGIAGMTIIDVGESTQPRVVAYFPEPNPTTGEINQDLAYVYKALVAHPTLPIMYGFTEQDYVYTITLNNGVQLASRDAYAAGAQPVCCVKSAARFMGNIFVAFSSRLVWFPTTASGALDQPGILNELQATNVFATARYLYVHHSPNSGQPQGQQYRAGYYVFDENGDLYAHLPTNEIPQNFTVSPQDTHILANDGTKTQIFLINWAR